MTDVLVLLTLIVHLKVVRLVNTAVISNVTAVQHGTAVLSCYSKKAEAAEWAVINHIEDGRYRRIYSVGYLQAQYEGTGKYNVSVGDGFYNLSIFDLTFDDAGRYDCNEANGFGPVSSLYLRVNDLDECMARNEVCSKFAACVNTHGSFSCSCSVGFSGDGFHCADVNECHNLTGCDGNAVCKNTLGSFSCTCKQGFVGDGRTGTCSAIASLAYLSKEALNGDTVSLSCGTASANNTTPVVWWFVDPDKTKHEALFRSSSNNNTSHSSNGTIDTYNSHGLDSNSIELHDVQPHDAGFYICVENNGTGHKYTYLLTVGERSANASSIGLQMALIVAIVAVLVAVSLAIAAVVIVYRRRRGRTGYSMQPRTDTSLKLESQKLNSQNLESQNLDSLEMNPYQRR